MISFLFGCPVSACSKASIREVLVGVSKADDRSIPSTTIWRCFSRHESCHILLAKTKSDVLLP